MTWLPTSLVSDRGDSLAAWGEAGWAGSNRLCCSLGGLVLPELCTLTPSLCSGLPGSSLVYLLLLPPKCFIFASSLQSSLWACAPFSLVLLLLVNPIQQVDLGEMLNACCWLSQAVPIIITREQTQEMTPRVQASWSKQALGAWASHPGLPMGWSVRGPMSQAPRFSLAPRLSPASRPGVVMFLLPPCDILLFY